MSSGLLSRFVGIKGLGRSSLSRSLGSNFRVNSSVVFQRYLSTEVQSKIKEAINKEPICLFMKGTPVFPQCGFSRAVVAILNMQGIERFNHVNVLENEEIRNGIKEFSSWPTIPQLYIKGEFIGGCDILMTMHQNGELEELLLKEKLVEPVDEEDVKPPRS